MIKTRKGLVQVKCVKAKAYSSSANLGPGYDTLAMAHTAFYDIVKACPSLVKGVYVREVTGPEAEASGRAETARKAVEALLELAGYRMSQGIELYVEKNVPPGRGLGSSGATAAAAVVAVNELLHLEMPVEALIKAAGLGEAAAAGQPHYDNVAASVLGGLTAVAGLCGEYVCAARIPLPEEIELALLVPLESPREGKTAFMRSILPERVLLSDAKETLAGLAMLIAGAVNRDPVMMGHALMSDRLVEPVRSRHIPCYDIVREAALKAGAYGVTISGAGPSMLALTARDRASGVSRAMVEAFVRSGCGRAEAVSALPAPGASVY